MAESQFLHDMSLEITAQRTNSAAEGSTVHTYRYVNIFTCLTNIGYPNNEVNILMKLQPTVVKRTKSKWERRTSVILTLNNAKLTAQDFRKCFYLNSKLTSTSLLNKICVPSDLKNISVFFRF